jgi:hypothetical protein
MTPVTGGNRIRGVKRIADAYRDGLLADRKMHRAANFVGGIDARDFLFRPANQP